MAQFHSANNPNGLVYCYHAIDNCLCLFCEVTDAASLLSTKLPYTKNQLERQTQFGLGFLASTMTKFAVTARSEMRANFTTSSIVFWVGNLAIKNSWGGHWITATLPSIGWHMAEMSYAIMKLKLRRAKNMQQFRLRHLLNTSLSPKTSYGNPIYFWVLKISLLSTIINLCEQIRCICSFRSLSRECCNLSCPNTMVVLVPAHITIFLNIRNTLSNK